MFKYRAEITKGEEIRYISHLDYAGIIERAICRAHLPAAYSEGFNPHMKLAFASALAVGVTSDAEYMDFELTKPLCQPEVFDRLKAQLLAGVELRKLKTFSGKQKALMAEVDLAKYEIAVPLTGTEAAVQAALAAFNQTAAFIYHRVTPKKTREIEIKQYIAAPLQAAVRDGSLWLTMDIIITQSGSIKPGEILGVLQQDFALPVEVSQALIYRRALLGSGRPLIELV